jgi:hypothetical protein
MIQTLQDLDLIQDGLHGLRLLIRSGTKDRSVFGLDLLQGVSQLFIAASLDLRR